MIVSSRFLVKSTLALAALVSLGLLAGCGKNKGKVYFGNLTDGAEVESPFTVEMRADNLVVEPAAEGVRDGHGHFHILVDVPVPMSLDPIPNDARHIHYGDGQTEAVLDLPEGEHTLVLQFAKGDHRPYDPQIIQEIRVNVTRRNPPAGAADGVEGADGAGNPPGGGANRTGADSVQDPLDRRIDSGNVPAPGTGPAMGPGMGQGGPGGRGSGQ